MGLEVPSPTTHSASCLTYLCLPPYPRVGGRQCFGKGGRAAVAPVDTGSHVLETGRKSADADVNVCAFLSRTRALHGGNPHLNAPQRSPRAH